MIMLNEKKDAAALFSNDYKVFLWKTLRISLRYPSMMLFVLRMIRMQKKSAKIRQNLMDSGIRIPPFVIASVTKRCNLHCSGCYHRTFHRTHEVEMDSDTLKAIFREAGELGVSIILIVGGEPLQRPDILRRNEADILDEMITLVGQGPFSADIPLDLDNPVLVFPGDLFAAFTLPAIGDVKRCPVFLYLINGLDGEPVPGLRPDPDIPVLVQTRFLPLKNGPHVVQGQ